jgi:hypothetical protein
VHLGCLDFFDFFLAATVDTVIDRRRSRTMVEVKCGILINFGGNNFHDEALEYCLSIHEHT